MFVDLVKVGGVPTILALVRGPAHRSPREELRIIRNYLWTINTADLSMARLEIEDTFSVARLLATAERPGEIMGIFVDSIRTATMVHIHHHVGRLTLATGKVEIILPRIDPLWMPSDFAPLKAPLSS